VKTGRLGADLSQPTRWRSLRYVTILAGIMGILAFYPLTGCSKPVGRMKIHTSPTTMIKATATPTQPNSPWRQIWSDEFDGPAGTPPDPSKWSPGVGGDGWGNQQLEYDTANQNAYQDGQGNLVLEARKGNPAKYQCWYGPCQYTSARLSTQGHFSFTYGLIEARIKIPQGQGIWSAFWMMGTNFATVGWPACGEIDIMENISQEPATIYGTAHGPIYSNGTPGIYQLKQGKFADSFHVFALQWDADHLSFLLDGFVYHTVNKSDYRNLADWVYNRPFFVLLTLPVGGVWPGSPTPATPFPQKMYISYVRAYTHV
jgi:beta-glucanase (GH16 family)